MEHPELGSHHFQSACATYATELVKSASGPVRFVRERGNHTPRTRSSGCCGRCAAPHPPRLCGAHRRIFPQSVRQSPPVLLSQPDDGERVGPAAHSPMGGEMRATQRQGEVRPAEVYGGLLMPRGSGGFLYFTANGLEYTTVFYREIKTEGISTCPLKSRD